MVLILSDPASPKSSGLGVYLDNGEPFRSTHGGQVMSREEHAQRIKELHAKRAKKPPRRGWTIMDQPQHHGVPAQPPHAPYSHQHEASIPEHSEPAPGPTRPAIADGADGFVELPQRPKLPAPRRSYSVTDHEPMPPNLPKPSHRLHLLDLPSELHYSIVDFLDPIDSVCFGLAHSALYAIHRRKHGTIRLSARYEGPNDMEWAWRGAGRLKRAETADRTSASELAHMRVQGQVYCRKCGVSRCELHRHLKAWMGDGLEYCGIREAFGPPPPPGDAARPYCYMSSPKNPHRCGRHGARTAGPVRPAQA